MAILPESQIFTRWFGWFMEREIPITMRRSLLTTFASALRIDAAEARYPLESYKSFGHFFARSLADGMRPIVDRDNTDSMCMPCDGEIVNIAEISFNQEHLLQLADERPEEDLTGNALRKIIKGVSIGPVKGATFRLESFLGLDPRFGRREPTPKFESDGFADEKSSDGAESTQADDSPGRRSDATASGEAASVAAAPSRPLLGPLSAKGDSEGYSKDRKLVYVVIYLRPKDYHHFHAPCEMVLQMRRHMPGFTFPVFKAYARRMNALFAMNERVVYCGRWKHGEIFYAAIGAYNVANIRLRYEPDFRANALRTELYPTRRVMESLSYEKPLYDNKTLHCTHRSFTGASEAVLQHSGVWVEKGEELGEFRLGSTVVLVFETPNDWQWNVAVGDKLKMGELLGAVRKS